MSAAQVDGVEVARIVRFCVWAAQMRALTAPDVIARFDVSRATAYRWLRAWRAANGIYA